MPMVTLAPEQIQSLVDRALMHQDLLNEALLQIKI